MIELEVPKDIRKYEAKLFGPFTTRQLICFAGACVTAFLAFSVIKNFITSTDVCIFAVIVIVLPFLLIGWVKPYGMPFEKFVQTAFVSNFISPNVRKYKTENIYMDKMAIDTYAKNTEKQRAKKLKPSKNKNLVAYK